MKLIGLGLNKNGQYDSKEIVFKDENKSFVSELALILKFPDIISKVYILKEKAELTDFNEVKALIRGCAAIKVINETDNPFFYKAEVLFKSKTLFVGFQLLNGKLYAILDIESKLLYVDIPCIEYGETVTQHTLSQYTESVCLYDLQCGNHTCYSCFEHKTLNGNRILILFGNGWQEIGFPYSDQQYPGLIGKTAENMRRFFKENKSFDFKDVYSGNIEDFVEVL